MAIQKIKKQKVNGHYTPIGWREWIYLPNHNDFAIKAKVDTGARTSALHATHIEEYKKNSKTWIRFRLHQSNEYVQIVSRLEPIAQGLEPIARWAKFQNECIEKSSNHDGGNKKELPMKVMSCNGGHE